MKLRDLPRAIQSLDGTIEGLKMLATKYRGKLPLPKSKPKSRYKPNKKRRSVMK